MLGFLANIAVALLALLATFYFVFIRFRREAILQEYKPGTAAYEMNRKLFNPLYLIVSAVVAFLFIANLFADSNVNRAYIERIRSDAPIFIALALLGVGIFLYTLNMFRKK